MTGPGGLRKKDIIRKRTSKGNTVQVRYVSKARSEKPLGEYIKKSNEARTNEEYEFVYRGTTYYAMKASTGMILYTKNRAKAARFPVTTW